MMSDHDIRARLDCRTPDGALLSREVISIFAAPMERRNDDLAARVAQCPNVRADVLLSILVGEAVARHADLHAVFFKNAQLSAAGNDNARRFQIRNGVLFASLPIVERVVVGDVDRLHAAQRQDVGVFRRTLKIELLFLLGRFFRQRALKIDERHVVRRKQAFKTGKEPAVALFLRDLFKAVVPLAQVIRRAERRIAADGDGEGLGECRLRRIAVHLIHDERRFFRLILRQRVDQFRHAAFGFFIGDMRVLQVVVHIADARRCKGHHQ